MFPHTKLVVSGRLVAAAARAVIDSGAERVLAIGPVGNGEVDRTFAVGGQFAEDEMIRRNDARPDAS